MSLAGALLLMMRLSRDTCYNKREQHSTIISNTIQQLSSSISRLSLRLIVSNSVWWTVELCLKCKTFFPPCNERDGLPQRSQQRLAQDGSRSPNPSLSFTGTLLSRPCSSSSPLFVLLLVNTSLASFATLVPPSYCCSSAPLVLFCPFDVRPSVQRRRHTSSSVQVDIDRPQAAAPHPRAVGSRCRPTASNSGRHRCLCSSAGSRCSRPAKQA
jgi:hypothetical protein